MEKFGNRPFFPIIFTNPPGKAGERGVFMFTWLASVFTKRTAKVFTLALIRTGVRIAKAISKASQEDRTMFLMISYRHRFPGGVWDQEYYSQILDPFGTDL